MVVDQEEAFDTFSFKNSESILEAFDLMTGGMIFHEQRKQENLYVCEWLVLSVENMVLQRFSD